VIDGIPANWNHASTLPDDVLAVVLAAGCPWLQVVSELAFTLAAMLAGCEDDAEMRLAVGEALAAKLLETARTGRMPGTALQ
jgi:hypothetical protein